MPFEFQELGIPGVIRVEAGCFGDDRGFFMETYKWSDFVANGIPDTFVQGNRSHSIRGVLRGMHYQMHPRAQGKLVMVLSGEVFDVAVDMRRGSPTFGHWIGETLSAENCRMLYIPPGFAHGFCVLSDEADLLYMVTQEYDRDLDRGFLWNDPEVGIEWPMTDPLLSAKDTRAPLLRDADNNFTYTP